MTLTDAIRLVVADSREQDSRNRHRTDAEIIVALRDDHTIDQDEITSWVEAEVIEAGSDLETAYRMVVDASGHDMARALQ